MIVYVLNDYWMVSVGFDINDNLLLWKVYVVYIWGCFVNVEVVYCQNDWCEVKLSYGVSCYSDLNLYQEIVVIVMQCVYMFVNQFVNVLLNFGIDSNMCYDVFYFSFGCDYVVVVIVMYQLMLWKKGDMGLQQCVLVLGGVYNECGFGISLLWSVCFEYVWMFKYDIMLSYGVEVSSYVYDGQCECFEIGFLLFNLLFQ